jgi:hypothetical protein
MHCKMRTTSVIGAMHLVAFWALHSRLQNVRVTAALAARGLLDGLERLLRLRAPAQQVRQLGDVRCNPAGLITCVQLGRRSPTLLLLEVDIGERLSIFVADNEAGIERLGARTLWPIELGYARSLPMLAVGHMVRDNQMVLSFDGDLEVVADDTGALALS